MQSIVRILGDGSENIKFSSISCSFSCRVILHSSFSVPAPSQDIRCNVFHLWLHFSTQNIFCCGTCPISESWIQGAQLVARPLFCPSAAIYQVVSDTRCDAKDDRRWIPAHTELAVLCRAGTHLQIKCPYLKEHAAVQASMKGCSRESREQAPYGGNGLRT